MTYMLKRHNPNLTKHLDHPPIIQTEGWSQKKLKRVTAILKQLQQLKKQLNLLLKG